MTVSVLITPVLIILLLLYCAKKRVNTYATFSSGAKEALALCLDIFPFLVAIFVAIQLFNASGLTGQLSTLLAPAFNILGIPQELTELMLIRPFSGTGSLAILENIYTDLGPDCYVSRCASVIMASSETVFYVATIYLSGTKVKRLLYAIPLALACNIFAGVLSCLVCRFL